MLAVSGWAQEAKPETDLLELVRRAESGDSNAQSNLGVCYYNGNGVTKDYKEAVKWYTKSSEQNNAIAQFNLGTCYEEGRGLAKDNKEAVKWYTKSAEQGNVNACRNLAVYYESIGDIPAFLTYSEQAAKLGDIDCMMTLSKLYFMGEKVEKNIPLSFFWVSMAAERGNPIGAQLVAFGYDSGLGTVRNPQLALLWAYIATAEGQSDPELFKQTAKLEKEFGPRLSAQLRDEARKQLAVIQGGAGSKDRETLKKPENTVSAKLSGTGFIISEDGVIITSAHLIGGAARVEVVVRDKRFQAKVIRLDPQNDLAVLKVEGTGIPPLPINDSAKVKVGQPAFTVGFPNIELQGSNPKMTKGDISSNTGFLDAPTCWQISIPVQTGNSGGPLFDEGGNVIGVIVSRLNFSKDGNGNSVPTQNVNYAVKSAYLLPMLNELNVKLPSTKNRWFFKGFESVVQDVEKSVVMILVY